MNDPSTCAGWRRRSSARARRWGRGRRCPSCPRAWPASPPWPRAALRSAAGRRDHRRTAGGPFGADDAGATGPMAGPRHGRNRRPHRPHPSRLIAALAAHPMLVAPQAEAATGASRATAQRNLDVLVARSLVREVTGQGRFRVWAAGVW